MKILLTFQVGILNTHGQGVYGHWAVGHQKTRLYRKY